MRHVWWRHQMETFSALLAICAGKSPVPVNFPHKGQWRGALMFASICVWINAWVNNRKAGDLRRYCAHYDVIVMCRGEPIRLIFTLSQNAGKRFPDRHIAVSVKSLRYGRRWHALVQDGHRSTANLLSFSGLSTSKLWSLRASCWCFWHLQADTRSLLTHKTCLWAIQTFVHTCGQFRARSVWNTDRRMPTAGNCGQQNCPP